MYRPWMNRRVGIEMEVNQTSTQGFRMSTTTLRDALRTHANVNAQVPVGTLRSDGTTWDCKTDGSCGYEIASPALTLNEDGHNAELRAVCATLNTVVHPRVDRRCGLHVHVELLDFDWRDLQKLIALWFRYEPFFFNNLPDSRIGNNYCGPVRASTWTNASRGHGRGAESLFLIDNEADFNRECSRVFGTKYSSLNLLGFWRHKRIEFRLHSGTVDYNKIRNWTVLLLALVGRVKAENAPPLARGVNQPRPEVGFRPEYVCKSLGLGATSWTDETPVAREVTNWVVARHAQYGARRDATAATTMRF